MPTTTKPVRKITISLPGELIVFADQLAKQNNTSRSQLFSKLLADFKAQEEERLAAEGYQFYAQEASDFADAITTATAEVFVNDTP